MNKNIFPESREELVSMLLGLGVVIVAVVIIFNFVVRNKGSISLPGVSTNKNGQNVLTTPGVSKDGESSSYEVKKGDSLWNIAVAKYGNGFVWTKIATQNNLKQPYQIEVGQKLVMPVISEAEIKAMPVPVEVSTTYTVLRGDSLWKIATVQLGNSYKWTQIWNLNKDKISNPNKIEIGMTLKLK